MNKVLFLSTRASRELTKWASGGALQGMNFLSPPSNCSIVHLSSNKTVYHCFSDMVATFSGESLCTLLMVAKKSSL